MLFPAHLSLGRPRPRSGRPKSGPGQRAGGFGGPTGMCRVCGSRGTGVRAPLDLARPGPVRSGYGDTVEDSVPRRPTTTVQDDDGRAREPP
eukprot:scaffold1320_cov326-Prasinococcus_capsulatus_cf.AAC.6